MFYKKGTVTTTMNLQTWDSNSTQQHICCYMLQSWNRIHILGDPHPLLTSFCSVSRLHGRLQISRSPSGFFEKNATESSNFAVSVSGVFCGFVLDIYFPQQPQSTIKIGVSRGGRLADAFWDVSFITTGCFRDRARKPPNVTHTFGAPKKSSVVKEL